MNKELEKHNRILNSIENALEEKDLPSISYANIESYLTTYFAIKGLEISKEDFKDLMSAIKTSNSFKSKIVKNQFYELLRDYNVEESKIKEIYENVDDLKIDHLMEEIELKEQKKIKICNARELKEHEDRNEQISNAKSEKDLPNINFSTFKRRVMRNTTNDVVEEIEMDKLEDLIKLLYTGKYDLDSVSSVVEKLCKSYKLDVESHTLMKNEIMYNLRSDMALLYLAIDLRKLELKKSEFTKQQLDMQEESIHKKRRLQISEAGSEKEILSMDGLLNSRVKKDLKDKFTMEQIRSLIEYVKENDLDNIKIEIKNLCSTLKISKEEKEKLIEDLYNSITNDVGLKYIVEDYKYNEKRRLEVIEENHESIMDQIKSSTIIPALPDITPSKLNQYLLGNTTIYSKERNIITDDLKPLVNLLLDGKKFEDEEVIKTIKSIASLRYPDKVDAFDLLYKKLSLLPKTYFMVEEIKAYQNQIDMIVENGDNELYTYAIPGFNTVEAGGDFYDIYASYTDIDLAKILPKDLNTLVKNVPDKDKGNVFVSYVREKTNDQTFRRIGGYILKRGENFKSLRRFKQNNGLIEITEEEAKEHIQTKAENITLEVLLEKANELSNSQNQNLEVLKTGIMNLINQYENENKKNMAMLEVLNEEINTKLNKEKTKKLD